MMKAFKPVLGLALLLSLAGRDLAAFATASQGEIAVHADDTESGQAASEGTQAQWDSTVAKVKEQLAVANLELAQIKKKQGEDSPAYKNQKSMIDTANERIREGNSEMARQRATTLTGSGSGTGRGYVHSTALPKLFSLLALMNGYITQKQYDDNIALIDKKAAEQRKEAEDEAKGYARSDASEDLFHQQMDVYQQFHYMEVMLEISITGLQDLRPEIKANIDVDRAQGLSADAMDIIVREKTEAGTRSADERQAIVNALYSGEASYDQAGYRIRRSNVVLRPDSQTVTRVYMTDRQDGPLFGLSIVSHKLSYNKALPDDWQSIVGRALNDAANLGGGSPDYYRTLEQLSFASPKGCQLCITQQLEAPSFQSSAWAQAYVQRYAVNGADRGYVSMDAAGAPRVGSDTISVSASKDGDAWTFVYRNQSLAVDIFSAKVYFPLASSDETLKGNATGANSATAGNSLWSLGGLPTGRNVEIILTGPSFTQSIDVVLAPQQYLTLFR